jgi:hypothetical protein
MSASKLIIYQQLVVHIFLSPSSVTEGSDYILAFRLLVCINRVVKSDEISSCLCACQHSALGVASCTQPHEV